MPAQLYQSPTGHELEIIPLSDISRFSEDVKLKVLYKTSPLAGAIMELDSVSYLKSSVILMQLSTNILFIKQNSPL